MLGSTEMVRAHVSYTHLHLHSIDACEMKNMMRNWLPCCLVPQLLSFGYVGSSRTPWNEGTAKKNKRDKFKSNPDSNVLFTVGFVCCLCVVCICALDGDDLLYSYVHRATKE